MRFSISFDVFNFPHFFVIRSPSVAQIRNFTTMLIANGEKIDPSTTIADALQLSDLTLHVGDDAFHCVINPPRIKALTLSPQVGCSVEYKLFDDNLDFLTKKSILRRQF